MSVYSILIVLVTPQVFNDSNIIAENFNYYEFEEKTSLLNEPTLEPTSNLDFEDESSDDENETVIKQQPQSEYGVYPDFIFHTACDDHVQLCINSKCCPMESQQFGCCPYQNGVCCPHLNRCCPNGYQCLSKSTANILEKLFGSRFATNFHCYVDLSIGDAFHSMLGTTTLSTQHQSKQHTIL